MKADFENVMYRLNCMTADLDSLYHQAALKSWVCLTACCFCCTLSMPKAAAAH